MGAKIEIDLFCREHIRVNVYFWFFAIANFKYLLMKPWSYDASDLNPEDIPHAYIYKIKPLPII